MKMIIILAVLVAMLAIPSVVGLPGNSHIFKTPVLDAWIFLEESGEDVSGPGFSAVGQYISEFHGIDESPGISTLQPLDLFLPIDPYTPPEVALDAMGIEDALPGFSEVGQFEIDGPGLSLYAMPTDPF